jgi:flagellar biosynthesis GTPase FlhF
VSEYRPGTEQWQLKPGSSKGKDAAWMASLGTQKEAGVVEEVTAGWKVYDATTRVWSEQAGVRVVRCAAAVQEELLAGLMAVEAKRKEDEARRKEEEESRKEKEARAVAAKRKEEEAMAAAAARAAAAAQRKEERARAAEAKRREEELLAGLRPKLDSINAEATKSHGHLVRHVFKTHPPKGNPELPSDFSQAGWCFLFVSTCVWICLHITGHHAAGS